MKKVYYNQADSRWAKHPYPSRELPKATIKSGGCGPTCAAMIVSSFKEIVKPDKMGDISIKNGYRVNGGTSFELFPFVAKKWELKTKTISSSYEAFEACKNGYFVVILCGAGLWTTGGHFILAVGAKDNKIEIYDPYLYSGKFNIYNRKGKVEVKGNSCFVDINIFKQYSNARRFFAFKSDSKKETNKKTVKRNTVGQLKKFKGNTIIYEKKNLSGIKYNYLPQTQVKILENVSDDIDKIKVIKTGRVGYVKINVYK